MKEMESCICFQKLKNIRKCNLPFAKHWSGQNSLLEASIEWINLGCFRGVVLSTRIFMCKKSTVNNTTPLSSQGLTLLHTKKESNNSRFWTKLSGQCHEASDASGKKKPAVQLYLMSCHSLKLCPGITMLPVITE